MNSQWNPYQGSRSVVPVMSQQQTSMVVPHRADMYYMNSAPSNQMVSYTSTNQQLTNMDSMAYNRYLSRPPQDVQYTMQQAGSSSGSYGDYPVDGWNGMWRQTSRAYKETEAQQPVPQQQQMMTYVTPAPMVTNMMHRVVNMPSGGYYA